jgi:hypothetical protein
VLPEQPALSFVADSLTFVRDTLRLARPGRPGERLALVRQGNFWRGTLGLDSASYPLLLVRRGDPEPAVYRVRRDEVAGTTAPALLFSPADESLPGLALAFFPSTTDAQAGPAWADALARQGHTVLLLPPADSLAAPALANALALLRRTAGVDTARVGTWVSGPAAGLLPLLLAENTASRPTFMVVQDMPAPGRAARLAGAGPAKPGAGPVRARPAQSGRGASPRFAGPAAGAPGRGGRAAKPGARLAARAAVARRPGVRLGWARLLHQQQALLAHELPGGALQKTLPSARTGREGSAGFLEQHFGVVVVGELYQ